MWNSTPALLVNNWAWENGYTYTNGSLQPRGNGMGFKLGGKATNDGGHTVRNNVAWKNLATGFHENSGDLGMKLYNNTAWSNVEHNFVFFHSTNTFRNNLSFGNRGRITGSDTYNS